MAVTKTPRKKSLPDATEEAKPAVKAKATPVKKAAVKAAEPAEAKAKAAPKATSKARAAKSPEPPPVEVVAAAVPAPKPVTKKVATTSLVLPPLVQSLFLAVQEGQAVEFIFADAETNAPRTFEPRHLTFDALSQAWFVWGWDRRYNAERHHRVDLLAEVNDVEGVGRAAQGPYPEGTPANQIGGWLGGEPIHVKATLLKQWVFAVKQAPPAFPNFKLEEQGDGQALVTFAATDLRAIARWAMQFGDGIQVAEPARLVDRIKQVGAVWAGRDRQVASGPAPKASTQPSSEPRRQDSRPHRESRHDREPRPDREARPEREARPDREARPEREPRPERESRPEREHRPEREREEAPKAKPGKVEVIRFDRL